jgi:hypothetical protein
MSTQIVDITDEITDKIEVESAVGLQNVQTNEMSTQNVDITDEIKDKIEITDMCAAGLHKPKMKGCDICEQTYM